MRSKELIQKRDKDIYKEYKRLRKKYSKYRYTAIVEMLSERFYLCEGTIERILQKKGKDEKSDT
jgi:hypothetical protein